MSKEAYLDILAEIERLPQGGITYKKINGREYAYYQWREDGKQRSRRAKDDELETLSVQIERRKELENVLREAGLMAKTRKAKSQKTEDGKPAQKNTGKAKSEQKHASRKKGASEDKRIQTIDAKIESRWIEDDRKAVRTALYRHGEENQAEELTTFLLDDAFFDGLPSAEREMTAQVLTDRIKARMQEDMVHLETKAERTDCEVFHLHMKKGVFEMVVADVKAGTCELYEIKHCNRLSSAHCVYLLNASVCKAVADRYGQITGKFVIYNGKTINVMETGSEGKLEGIKYWNVEQYVEDLKK